MLDSNGEVVLGISGRNTLDVVSVGIRLNEQGQRWHTAKQMQALQKRYQESVVLMKDVPPEYQSAAVSWFDVPADLKDAREAKTKHHTVCRDIDEFVTKYPCWRKEEIMAEP